MGRGKKSPGPSRLINASKTISIIAGVGIFLCGLVFFAFGIATTVLKWGALSFVGTAIWSGLFHIIAGVLILLSRENNTIKMMVILKLVLSVFSMVFGLIILGFSAYELDITSAFLEFHETGKGRAATMFYLTHSDTIGAIALHAIMLLFSVIVFCFALFSTVVCSMLLCRLRESAEKRLFNKMRQNGHQLGIDNPVVAQRNSLASESEVNVHV